MDAEIKKITSRKPHMVFLASHPVYQYFARRYHLDIQSLHWEPHQFPNKIQWQHLKTLIKKHPTHWMLWEQKPLPKTIKKLKTMHINSLVFNPCANKPTHGNFISIMQSNIKNLKMAY